MTDDLASLRGKLLRKQYYAIFMEPPAPFDDPIASFGDVLREHLMFLNDLEKRGILFASGPFRDEATAWGGDGMALIRAASLEEAEAIAQAEPFQKAGIRQNRVRPWQLNEGGFSISVRLMDKEFELA